MIYTICKNFENAIDKGIDRAYELIYQRTDNPTKEQIKGHVKAAILSQLNDIITSYTNLSKIYKNEKVNCNCTIEKSLIDEDSFNISRYPNPRELVKNNK